MNTSSAEFLATKANKDSANTNAVAAPPEMIGAEMLVHALHKEGVEYVWGYPGGSVLFIYDEIFKQDKFEHILVRHEQAAVHAADGYARATGKVGVALVTSGPGVTNAVTGIATAYTDSIPMVIISGNVPTHAIGEDAFQEADTVGITRPIVKHNFLVKGYFEDRGYWDVPEFEMTIDIEKLIKDIDQDDSGWVTIFATDGEDLYVYQTNPTNPREYRYKGAWEAMRTVTETIPVKGAAPTTVPLRYTRHGPVVYEDTVHHVAYAVRAAWLEPGASPYLASLRMDQAKTWAEFRAACAARRFRWERASSPWRTRSMP